MNNDFFSLGKIPNSLSKIEQETLLKLYKNENNLDAKDKLIIHNLKLVKSEILRTFMATPYDKYELMSVGIIGLIKGTETFSLDKNISFSTYATTCIRNEIIKFIRIQSKETENFTSINIDNDKEEIINCYDFIPDDTINIEKTYEDKEQKLFIQELLSTLNEEEYSIIELYFGLNNNKKHTLNEIGKKLNFSRQYAHVQLKKILNKLKIKITLYYNQKKYLK